MKHTMIDIETLGTRPGCMITQIAAVHFDMDGDFDPCTFDYRINIATYGDDAVIDPATLQWWSGQDPVVYSNMMNGEYALVNVLRYLDAFLLDSEFLWAKSPTFDMVLIEHWRQKYLMDPWDFRSWLDVRTALSLAGVVQPRAENAHDAVSDCIAQIKGVQLAYDELGSQL